MSAAFRLAGESDAPSWCWDDSGAEWSQPGPTNLE